MKEKILDMIMEEIDCFDATKEDFEKLKSLNAEDLERLNQKAIVSTPLLTQICNYAMADMLTDDYMVRFLNNSDNVKEKLKAIRTMKLCTAYVDELYNNKCAHPTIIGCNDLIFGVELYNTIINLISETPCYLDKTTSKLFKNFLENVDSKIAETISENCDATAKGIDKAKDSKTILNLMTKFARLRGSILSLLNTGFSTNIFDGVNLIKTTNDGSVYSVILSEMIEIINSMNINLHDAALESEFGLESENEIIESVMKENKMEEEAKRNILCDNLVNILGAYESYKNNQFSYLKSRSEELKILDQCNKGVK